MLVIDPKTGPTTGKFETKSPFVALKRATKNITDLVKVICNTKHQLFILFSGSLLLRMKKAFSIRHKIYIMFLEFFSTCYNC